MHLFQLELPTANLIDPTSTCISLTVFFIFFPFSLSSLSHIYLYIFIEFFILDFRTLCVVFITRYENFVMSIFGVISLKLRLVCMWEIYMDWQHLTLRKSRLKKNDLQIEMAKVKLFVDLRVFGLLIN